MNKVLSGKAAAARPSLACKSGSNANLETAPKAVMRKGGSQRNFQDVISSPSVCLEERDNVRVPAPGG